MRLHDLSIERIHTWAFYLLCGFALFSNISIAIANIFLGTLTALVLFRLWRKHDDWKNALPDGHIGIALLILMGAVILSSCFSTDISRSLRFFGDYYGYRMLALYAVLLMIREKRQLARIGVCVAVSFVINDLAIVFQGLVQGNYRASGFSIYMSVGGFLSMILPVLVLLLLSGRLDARYRLPTAITLVIGCMALLFNGTRGAWLAVPIAAFICAGFLIRDRKKLLVGTAIGALIFAGIFAASPALSSRFATISDTKMQSNSERFLLWTSACRICLRIIPCSASALRDSRRRTRGSTSCRRQRSPILSTRTAMSCTCSQSAASSVSLRCCFSGGHAFPMDFACGGQRIGLRRCSFPQCSSVSFCRA